MKLFNVTISDGDVGDQLFMTVASDQGCSGSVTTDDSNIGSPPFTTVVPDRGCSGRASIDGRGVRVRVFW